MAPGIGRQMADAEALTPYAVDARYPSEKPPVERQEAAGHLTMAQRVLDTVAGLLQPYLDAGRPGG